MNYKEIFNKYRRTKKATPNPQEAQFKMHSLSLPEQSEWSVQIVQNFTLNPNKGTEPNRFHRWMQELAFGFKWVKRK